MPTYNVDDLPHQACESDNADMFRPTTTTYEHSKTVDIVDIVGTNDKEFDVLVWIPYTSQEGTSTMHIEHNILKID